jgi:hypothetical protein
MAVLLGISVSHLDVQPVPIAVRASRGALRRHMGDASERLRVLGVPSLEGGDAIDGMCAFHRLFERRRTCEQ